MAKKIKENGSPKGLSNRAVPEGYSEESGDLVGFWDPEVSETIHFIPLYARAFDSKLDKTKPSVLVTGKLVDPTMLKIKGEEIDGASDDLIGVFWKPGMKALGNLCGAKVFMYQDGEIDTGKPNPMKIFKIFAKEKGAKLFIVEDLREHSKNAKLFLQSSVSQKPVQNNQNQDADDIAF